MAKRRRRSKIEDVQIDIGALFASKKRFKPDDSTCESIDASSGNHQSAMAKQSLQSGASAQTRAFCAKNLLAQYMEQVGEHDVAN